MKKIIVLLLCAAWSVVGLGQPAVIPAQTGVAAPSADAERTRISAERARLEAGFAAEDAVCYRKFMVNNCLDDVKLKRRDALSDLRRQEISLDEQERKAKGADQLRKTEEKSSLKNQQEAADKRASALKDFADRMDREKQKKEGRATMQSNEKLNSDAAANRNKANQDKAGERANRQANTTEEVRIFNERLAKAKDRQARHDRDKASQTKPPANPLPTPVD